MKIELKNYNIEFIRITPRLTINAEPIQYIIDEILIDYTYDDKKTDYDEEVIKFIFANLIYNKYKYFSFIDRNIVFTAISTNIDVWRNHRTNFGYEWMESKRINKALNYLVDKKYILKRKIPYDGLTNNCYLLLDKRVFEEINIDNQKNYMVWIEDFSDLEGLDSLID